MSLACCLLLLAAPAGAAARPVKVVSYNVAGVPVVHPKIDERMKAIGELLAKGAYDVVALQEVWRDSDADKLIKASGLPYRARSPQRWLFGDGLLILSRWRVLDVESLGFDDRTEHWLRADGEQFAHKGALRARIDAPGGELDIIDTHLVADYRTHKNGNVRAGQVHQLINWAAELERGRRFVLAGDLNMPPEDPLMLELRDGLGLRDACRPACDASSNGRRIDYILATPSAGKEVAAQVLVDEYVLVGKKPYRVSDHRAILAVVQ